MLTTLDRLTFGRNRPDGGQVTPRQWQEFERDVIAPTFPDGYTVIHGEGGWRDSATGRVINEPSVIVEFAHGGDRGDDVNAIGRQYKAAFQQDAVMRSTLPIAVSFI